MVGLLGEHLVVELDGAIGVAVAEAAPGLVELLGDRLVDAPRGAVARVAATRRLGHEHTRASHHASAAATHERPRFVARGGRRQPCSGRPEHGPSGVVVLQRGVVGVVEVTGVVLALEVLEGAEEEVALVLEAARRSVGGPPHRRGRARPAHGPRPWVTTARRAPPPGERGHHAGQRHDQPTTGRIHTSPAKPDAGGSAAPRRRSWRRSARISLAVCPPPPAARSRLGWPASAATSESATDWLRQTGHLSVRAIASTCSSVVRGGPSRTWPGPATPRTSAAITIQPSRRPGSHRRLAPRSGR